jgi:hypothetical protein
MKHILDQYDKYLKDDRDYRRDFTTTGLRTLLEIKLDKHYPEELQKKIEKICRDNYQPEVIEYYSPDFQEFINKKMEDKILMY